MKQSKQNKHRTVFLLIAIMSIAVAVFSSQLISKQTRAQKAMPAHATNNQSKKPTIDGFILPTAKSIQPFTVTNNSGQPFTQNDLKGHWTLLFFGFTNCGMICPTTLASLNKMYQRMETQLPAQAIPQVILMSVDPERDTINRLNQYVHSFNPHFIGLRAPLAVTQAMEKQFNVVAVRINSQDNAKQYTMNHSADIMVINPQGALVALLSYPHKAMKMLADIKTIQQP